MMRRRRFALIWLAFVFATGIGVLIGTDDGHSQTLLPMTAAATSRSAHPALAGVWLVELAAGMAPSELIRSKLTLTDHTFTLDGYLGMRAPWRGSYTLGASDASQFDLYAEALDLSERGPSKVIPASTAKGIFRLVPAADGDRLCICLATGPGAARPTEFRSIPGASPEAAPIVRTATFVRVPRNFKELPDPVTVTVLEPNGRPAADARFFARMDLCHESIGKTSQWDTSTPLTLHYNSTEKTGIDGTAHLPLSEFQQQFGAPVGAHDPVHRWTGFTTYSPGMLRNGKLTIRMQPEQMIRGGVTCSALTRSGKEVTWRAIELYSDGIAVARSDTETGTFAFPMPPGTYGLHTCGWDLHGRYQRVTLVPGTGDLIIPPIDLEPSEILALIGKTAPPLDGVVAWKNGSVGIASLKGKVVLIHFWGYWCGPCVAEMPMLMHVYEKYKNRGLAVVAVHLDNGGEVASVKQLDAKTARYRTTCWGGKDIAFPVALLLGPQSRNPVVARYGVLFYPTTNVVGRDGKVLGTLGDQVPFNLFDDEKIVDAGIEKLLNAK